MGFSPREKCKQAISAGFQNCWLPVLLNCVLGYSFSSSLNKELRTATGLSEMWEPLWNHWEAFRWSTLFLLTQLSHQGPVPILGCLSDVSEVREQLSNLSELASDERKEVKGIVISPLEFFLCGEEEIVFVAPVGFFFFWVGGVDEVVLPIMRMRPFMTSAEGRGRAGLSWWFRLISLCLLFPQM